MHQRAAAKAPCAKTSRLSGCEMHMFAPARCDFGRLTYNFYIKGGFTGGEDYRWAVIRKWYPGWRWEVFNLIFICHLVRRQLIRSIGEHYV